MLRTAIHSNGIITIQFLLNLLMLIDDEVNEVFIVLRGVVVVLSSNILGQSLTLMLLLLLWRRLATDMIHAMFRLVMSIYTLRQLCGGEVGGKFYVRVSSAWTWHSPKE